MITKRFELLDKGNKKHKLTVTPSRITIKLAEGSSQLEQDRVLVFLTNVAYTTEMTTCTQSFRGTVDTEHDRFYVVMSTDSKSVNLRFDEVLS